MKTTNTLTAVLSVAACALALSPLASAQQRTLSQDVASQQPQRPSPVQQQQPAAPAPASEPGSLQSAIQGGKVSLDMRLRYEFVDQEGFANDANALTLRTRLGYTTAKWHGIDVGVEAENVVEIVDDYYNTLDAKPGYPGVMDPEVTEVNQAWIRYTNADIATQFTAGRQRIVLDNTRFVGDVGWRQDNQTFDAVRIQNNYVKDLSINYAYLWRINRVQGDQRDWESDSHLLNASYSGWKYGTITAYGYLFDFDGTHPATIAAAAAARTQTFGASFVGAAPITPDKKLKLNYRAEYATQSDYSDNPRNYTADYYVAELGATYTNYGLTLGYEVLGSDNGEGFRTPLATLHAFNGWSDWNLPLANGFPKGLRDAYVKVSATLPGKVQMLAFYHKFEADSGGADYGDEIDVQATYRLNKNIAFLAKAAFFSGKNGTPDITKFWLQTEYSF